MFKYARQAREGRTALHLETEQVTGACVVPLAARLASRCVIECEKWLSGNLIDAHRQAFSYGSEECRVVLPRNAEDRLCVNGVESGGLRGQD